MQLLVGGVVGDELSESLSSLQALSMSAKDVINRPLAKVKTTSI
ncbi:hypothetical protein NRA09_05155 [Acinetobacter baumannii]|nr:hypothetical protein [Acinetobacter baumannii]